MSDLNLTLKYRCDSGARLVIYIDAMSQRKQSETLHQ